MRWMSKSISKNVHHEKGTILLIVLFVSVVLLLLTAPHLFELSNQQRAMVRSLRVVQSVNLAEAGVEQAIWELRHGTWVGTEDTNTNLTMSIDNFMAAAGNVVGDIDVVVFPLDSATDTRIVESTGFVEHIDNSEVSKRVRVVLEKVIGSGEPLFFYGLFADEGMELNSNMIIDSYDSRNGKYGGNNKGSEGNIGTNAIDPDSIYLDSNAQVFGSATSGAGSDPDSAIGEYSNAQIHGAKQALPDPLELPPIPPPSGLPNMGSYWIGDQDIDTISTSGQYSSFTLDSNSRVTITGNVTLYITGDFNILSNARLIITDGASVEVYLGGDLYFDSNTRVNNISEDPTKFLIFGLETAQTATYNSNQNFYGAMYMPEAYIENNSNSHIYGAFVGEYYYQDSNGQLHFDNYLTTLIKPNDGDIDYVVKSWQQLYSNWF
jgi:hypothetical protein